MTNKYKRTDFIPTDRWNTEYTTGVPLMKKRGSVACTGGADTVTLTVPKGERWVIYGLCLVNGTLSQDSCLVKAEFLDAGGNAILIPIYESASTSGNYHAAISYISPYVLYEGQSVKFTWDTDVHKSGTGYYYVNALQFDVGKGS